MGVSGQHHALPTLYPPSKGPPVPTAQEAEWGPRASLDIEVRGKISCLCRGSNLDCPVVQSVARHYSDWATLVPMVQSTCIILFGSLKRISDDSPHFTRKSLQGGGGGALVGFGGDSLLGGGLKVCYWWKTVWCTRESYTTTYRLKTSSIWEQHVASAPLLRIVGVVIMSYIESHWIHQNTWKPIVWCFFSGCGINA
jgi:hypothetical protein